MSQKTVSLNDINISNELPLTLIAGPCVLESHAHARLMVEKLLEITSRVNINFIYKTSYDKANRTSLSSVRGLGIDTSLKIFSELKSEYNIPILTDVHTAIDCDLVKDHVDILQIPAFLCRQTDLLIAAATTGKIINVKKGQFLAPHDMINVAKKILESGNKNLLLTERGVSFGYNTLISDFRSIPILKKFGHPVVFDATHSVQQPGGLGDKSGGQREFVPTLATAAAAIGVGAIFMEAHEDPDNAPSDGPNMMPLNKVKGLLETLIKHDKIAKNIL